MVIRALDVVDNASTGDQGHALYLKLMSALSGPDIVTLSFDGIKVATSSFVNAAFVELLEMHGYVNIKSRLRVVHSTKQINDLIKARLTREAGKAFA